MNPERTVPQDDVTTKLAAACREALLWIDQDSRGGEECNKMIVAAIEYAEAHGYQHTSEWKRFACEIIASDDLILEQLRSAIANVQRELDMVFRRYRRIKEGSDSDCTAKALSFAEKYAGIDGGHHKQWVIDQMVRALTGDKYDAWVEQCNYNEEEPDDPYDWDTGIAP